jgi:hypothetical protein
MDNFRVGGTPTLPLDAGFSPEDTARTIGSAPTRRSEIGGGLSNAAMTDYVGGDDPAGPNVGNWLDAPAPGQDVDMTALMVTLHQAAVTIRTAMHEAQQVARDAQQAEMRAEAQDIRSSAGFAFAAGLAAGLGQIAGGALDIAGSAAAADAAFPEESADDKPLNEPGDDQVKVSKGLGSNSGIENDSMEPAADTQKAPDELETAQKVRSAEEKKAESSRESHQDTFDKAREVSKRAEQQQANFKNADIILTKWSGLSKAVDGLGKVASSGLEFGSRQQDAAEKDDEAGAMKAAAQVDDAANLLKNIDDLISGVRQTFSQMIEAKNDAMNRVTQL